MNENRIQWHSEKRPLSELNPHPKNPRIITDERLKQLESSFNDIGNAQPININLDGTILSGHARYKQLSKEEVTEVECYVPDRTLTPKQEEAVIIRMNKNIIGSWDYEILQEDYDIDDLLDYGFDEKEFPKVEDSYSDKNEEINTDNFGNDLEHTCPKCGFEFNE